MAAATATNEDRINPGRMPTVGDPVCTAVAGGVDGVTGLLLETGYGRASHNCAVCKRILPKYRLDCRRNLSTRRAQSAGLDGGRTAFVMLKRRSANRARPAAD